ncbi:unnamed protein product [Mytilus edulis]|uniref:Uncharacterized protein n=1 Tax=Mytilus edulis TaxID=6550 RepID=A0A8S3SX82_MYTED|nr:unnamed protein product [Mytilus edulis]
MIKKLQRKLAEIKSARNKIKNKRIKECFDQCDKLDNFRAECRNTSRRNSRVQDASKWKKTQKSRKCGTTRILTKRMRKHHVKSEDGMYVGAILNIQSGKLFVDKEATLSIVSNKLYESLQKHSNTLLVCAILIITSVLENIECNLKHSFSK